MGRGHGPAAPRAGGLPPPPPRCCGTAQDAPGHSRTPSSCPWEAPGAAGWGLFWPDSQTLLRTPLESLEFLQDTLAQTWALEDDVVLRHLMAQPPRAKYEPPHQVGLPPVSIRLLYCSGIGSQPGLGIRALAAGAGGQLPGGLLCVRPRWPRREPRGYPGAPPRSGQTAGETNPPPPHLLSKTRAPHDVPGPGTSVPGAQASPSLS